MKTDSVTLDQFSRHELVEIIGLVLKRPTVANVDVAPVPGPRPAPNVDELTARVTKQTGAKPKRAKPKRQSKSSLEAEKAEKQAQKNARLRERRAAKRAEKQAVTETPAVVETPVVVVTAPVAKQPGPASQFTSGEKRARKREMQRQWHARKKAAERAAKAASTETANVDAPLVATPSTPREPEMERLQSA